MKKMSSFLASNPSWSRHVRVHRRLRVSASRTEPSILREDEGTIFRPGKVTIQCTHTQENVHKYVKNKKI